MKERILGLDTGTNSVGWAVVDYNPEVPTDKYTLVDAGVNIFQEGVKIEKGTIEYSRAAERTGYRRQRIGYWRRKVRKIKLLKILIKHGLCPFVSDDALKNWRTKKEYPLSDEFVDWQRTDEAMNKNPYYYRNLCLSEKLDMDDVGDRYIVGRAIYHINQRRGFLSNRKEEAKESDGKVAKSISDINDEMETGEYEYLGQYFYSLYQRGERIRAKYTDRLEHYEKELLAICEKQGLGEELAKVLRKTIITQRPLKSQKHTVGRCVFEPNKTRCPISHPMYEQYRMYAFVNNIKIQTPIDSGSRNLTREEKDLIIPLFLRKSKKDFGFDEIAKKLSGTKNNFCYYKDKSEQPYRFNYHMDTRVSGCPVIAQLSDVFECKASDDSWLEAACEVYVMGGGKTRFQIMNDIWHALFFFEDKEHLFSFAKEKLQLDDEHAKMFSNIKVPSDYASLSLAAIRKILPYMKHYGLIYSHAVFLANMYKVVPCAIDKEALLPMLPKEDAEDIVEAFDEYDPQMSEIRTREEYVKRYVACKYQLDEEQKRRLKVLYHPSQIDLFPKVRKPTEDGYFQLGSPRTSSVRNPMAMHSLFRMRHVINTLLKEGKIDEFTSVRIELARELNDSNRRAAIRQWQNDNEKKNVENAKHIKEHFGESYVPTSVDLLKYKLWEEQNHLCLYTGETIRLGDLFDKNKYDIEHTIPRSVGGDSTAMNLTVCQSRFNREVKKTCLPSELENYEAILERVEHWNEKYEQVDKQLRKLNTRGVADKELKDRIIQKRHRLALERDYWQGKYSRFIMKEVPEGFSRRQGADAGLISKYARLYLKSLFRNVSIVKGLATSDFRKIWGLQDKNEQKRRENHCHHAIDAVTIACIGRAEYDQLAQYYHDEERHRWGMNSCKGMFPKPWQTFTEDVKSLADRIFVSHYTADNMSKRTKKHIRKNGKVMPQFMQGDTARGPLHLDTFYGAIERDGEIKYVVRKSLDQVLPKDEEKFIDKIVDEKVKEKVKSAKDEYGSLKKAVAAGIWMNRDKGVKINRVRIFCEDVKHPIEIRIHRDISRKKYKQYVNVKNEVNYMMVIYVGKDKRGKEKRSFELVNNYDAVAYHNSDLKVQGIRLFQEYKDGYPQKWQLKTGSMVLLYEETPEEIYELPKSALTNRLYRVAGMSSMIVSGCHYGTIALVHHQEARPSSEVKLKNGAYRCTEDFRAGIKLYHTQFKALVQNQDFTINEIGEIKFLHR